MRMFLTDVLGLLLILIAAGLPGLLSWEFWLILLGAAVLLVPRELGKK